MPNPYDLEYTIPTLDGSVDPSLQSVPYAFDTQTMPKLNLQPQKPPQGGLIGNALTAGYHEMLGNYANAASAYGAATGNIPAADAAYQAAQQQNAAAEPYRDEALETAPWNPGGSWWNLPRQIPYQVAKNIPNVLPTLAGGAAGALAGLRAGPVGAAVGGALGAFGATYPQSVGSIYGEALEKNGGKANPEAAKEAGLYGVPHALLDTGSAALGAAIFGKAAVKAGEMTLKQAAKTVLADTAKEALAEGATEGAQRLIELTQRPDMTPGQKANSFIENAFFGAMAGGGMGGMASSAGHAANQVMRATRQIDPAAMTPDDIKATTATAAPTQGDQQRAAEAQQAQQAQAIQQQPVQEPQIEGEVTTAPSREYSPGRQFAEFSDADLTAGFEEAQRTGNQGMLRYIQQEQQARVENVQANEVERQRIRDEQQAYNNDKARKELLDKAGLKQNERSQLAKFNYLDDMVLADQVGEELKREKPNAQVTKLAKYLGLLGEDGKPQDLASRLEAAHLALEKASNEGSRYKISKDLENLSRQFDLQQRMADRVKPEPTPTDVQGRINDAAQEYVQKNNLSPRGARAFLDNVQKALENGVEPVRNGPAKDAFKFVREQMSQQEQPSTTEAPTAEQPQRQLTPDAEKFLDSIKDMENPAVMMTSANRKIFQDNGVYSPTATPGDMIQQLRAIREQATAGVTNGQSTDAASRGNDVLNGGNVQGSPAGPAVEGSVSFAPGEGRQAQPVRQGQVGPAVQGQGPAAQGQVSPQGQPVRESGQQGVWTGGGQTKSVTVSPEVRKLGNGKEVRKVTTAEGKTYYVPAEKVSVGGPTASTVAAMTDPTSPSPPPAVDTSAPGVRPSAPGTRRESVAPETSSAPRSAAEMTRKVEDVLKAVTGSMTYDRISRLVRQGVFYVASSDHINEEWGPYVPEVSEIVNAGKLGESVRMRGAASQMPVFNDLDKLSPTQQEHLVAVLNAEAEDQIKPMASSWYDAHEHIIESPDLTNRQKNALKTKWQELRKKEVRTVGSEQVRKIYDAYHQLNDAAMHEWNAVSLLKLLSTMDGNTENLPEPHVDFQMKEDITDTPESLRDFWADEKNKAVAAAKRYIDQLTKIYEDPDRPDAERKSSKKYLGDLSERLEEIHRMEQRAGQVPYSHLGRFGDEIVVFRFPTIEEEDKDVVDPKAVARVAAAFDKAKLGVTVNPTTTQKYAYMRFETIEDRRAAAELVQQLMKEGAVSKEEGTFQAGPRDSVYELSGMSSAERASFESMLADVKKDNDAFAGMEDEAVTAAREQLERKLRALIIDSLPDSSVRKVMVSRKRVTGAASDMIRSAAHRFEVNNVAIASMISNPKALRALRGIKEKAKEAGTKESPAGLTSDDPTFYRQLYHEFAMRHLQAGQMAPGNNYAEVIKALTFTGAMGANVSTALLQGLSVATLGLPRLGAHAGVGMVRAARALIKAISPAMRILAASLSDAIFNDPTKIGDVVITPALLKKAGFNPESRDAKFIMRVINSGIIEMGTLARDLGAIVANKQGKGIATANVVLRWANAMNQYMEVASRLTMAFASLEVHNGERHGDLYEFTKRNISNSLFDFSNNNQGRLFNRSANPIARLSTQFMSYPAMWTQLLYREFSKGFLQNVDKETQREARDFLKMHFGMMVALAGVSGLPFAGGLAAALNSMFGSDDEPFDIEAEIRKYFSLWFGNDVADVAMRGLPRLANVDVSNRVGGQDLMPFSQFLADQRGWKESVQALIGRGLGAPASVLINMLGGLDKIHGGDIWGGMKDLLPRGVHNWMDAAELAGGGPHRDTKGHAIPGEVGVLDPATRFIGFKTGTEADWSEKRRINDSYEKQLQSVTRPIISGFVRAAQDRNKADMDYYLRKAEAFDKKHPEANIGKQMASALKGEMHSSMKEQATNLPRAVNTKDPRLMDMLSGFRQ